MPPTESTPPPTIPSEPHQGWTPKTWIIVISVALVIIGLVAWLAFRPAHQAAKSTTTDTSLYYDRAGYDRQDLRADIGDPSALVLTAQTNPLKLGSTGPVLIPACSILNQADIQAQGLKLYVNGFGWPVQQRYLDPSGRATFSAELNQYPTGSEAAGCSYGLASGPKGDLQSITVSLNQSFNVSSKLIDSYIESFKYKSVASISGFKTYKRAPTSDSDTETYYLLRSDDATVEVKLRLSDTSKYEAIVKTAADHLNALKGKPQGRSVASYPSPTFTQAWVKACDLLDNDNIKQLTGTDASPLVTELWPTAIGVADFASASDYKTKTNYLRSRCVRRSPEAGYTALARPGDKTVQLTATTYENAQAASKGLLYLSVGDQNDTKIKGSGIGEEVYAYQNKDDGIVVAFRQGRIVVEMVYHYPSQSETPVAMAEKLSPLGENIATRLKSFN